MFLDSVSSRLTAAAYDKVHFADGLAPNKPPASEYGVVEHGLLVAGMAHEFKNAIGSSLIAAETALSLLQKQSIESPIIHCLNDVISGMDRCNRIAETVIQNLNSLVPRKQRHDLLSIVKRAISVFLNENLCSEANLDFCSNTDQISIYCNDFEIELALVNILRNSIQNGNRLTKISIAAYTNKNFAVIQISDDGPGISGCSINNIFEPFYTTRMNQRGTGLGLYLVKKIIHQSHQGHIRVDSVPGNGATFMIQLPI